MPKDMPAQVGDGLVNVISGVGTSADKNIANRYALDCLDQGQAEAMYRTSWLARKVVDLPPFDMTRAWRDWQAEDDQIELLEAEEKRLSLASKVRRALVLAALHGGGALVLGGARLGDPTQELAKVIAKGALEYVHVVSRHQLTLAGDIERDINSPWFGHPQRWVLSGTQQEMHPSRVIAFVGQPLPEGSLVGGLEAFWGDSLLSTLKGAITNADLVQSAIAALVNEAKVDTLKIPGLTDLLMTAEGEAQLMKRINVANLAKSLLNTRILDKDEDWETMQLTFSQLDSIARTFLQIAAGAADIPATRLLGTAPQGMNATGEGDQQNYDTMIASKQESDLRPPLERLDEVLIPSVLGSRPPELHWSFAPLRVETEGQKADVAKKKAETTQIYANSGLLPDTALAKSVQNQLVEDGVYPGLEEALADAEQAGEVPSILEEPEEPEEDPSALQAANNNDPDQVAKQAAVDAVVRAFDLSGAVVSDELMALISDAADAARKGGSSTQPRVPAGSSRGGEFASKKGSSTSGAAASAAGGGGAISLSAEETAALSEYKNGNYKKINDHLRKGKPADAKTKAIVGHMDTALSRASLPKSQKLYRGLQSAEIYRAATKDPKSLVGKILDDPGFMSTSTKIDIAASFTATSGIVSGNKRGVVFEISTPKGAKGMHIDFLGKKSKKTDKEGEVLFGRGARVKITSIDTKTWRGNVIIRGKMI